RTRTKQRSCLSSTGEVIPQTQTKAPLSAWDTSTHGDKKISKVNGPVNKKSPLCQTGARSLHGIYSWHAVHVAKLSNPGITRGSRSFPGATLRRLLPLLSARQKGHPLCSGYATCSADSRDTGRTGI
ncbi:unnamed protein product, partial [Staurois parvus]